MDIEHKIEHASLLDKRDLGKIAKKLSEEMDDPTPPESGQRIYVRWGRYGLVSALVDRVSRNGRVYASRWNKSRLRWTKPRPLHYDAKKFEYHI